MNVRIPDDLGPQLDPRTIEVGDVVYYKDTIHSRFVALQITKITRADDYLYLYSFGRVFGVNTDIPYENQYNKFYKSLGPEQRAAQKNVLIGLKNSGTLPGNITNKVRGFLGLGGRRRRRRQTRRHKR